MGVQFSGNILVQSNGGPLPIINGGTGETTASAARNALLPSQTGNTNKFLRTDGTNVSWENASGTPGGSDTNIQFNDSGTFGGNANLVVNKSTGAVTGASTFTGTGFTVTAAAATIRSIRFQTAGSDRWVMEEDSTPESGSNAGSDFAFARYADNGNTRNNVFTVLRSTGVVDFKVAPTLNGSPFTSAAGTLTGTTLAANVVSSSLTTVGTLSALAVTGTTTQTGALNLAGASSALQVGGSAGSSGQVLTSAGTGVTPTWSAIPAAAAGDLTGATLAAGVTASSLTSVGTLGSLNITGNASAANPTLSTHLTTKSYVDALVEGLVWKSPAVAATTANITLSGTQTIDGVAVIAGDRVLVKNQSTATQNGVYVAAAGAWARSSDMDGNPGVGEVNGAALYVTDGTVNGDTTWTQTATIVTVGTQAMVFVQMSGSGSVNASTLSGTTLAANVVSSSLTTVGTLSALAVTGTTTHTGATNFAGASSPVQVGGSAGSSGQVLTSAGTGVTPTWTAIPAAAAGTLTGATLAAGVTASSLTSVGTLTSLTVTGNITFNSGLEVGTKIIPQNSQSTAYTLVLADSGKHILHPSADTTARTFTIPANSSVAYPIGTSITFINQNGAGVVTIAITSDTMRLAGAGTTGSRTLAANGMANAVKITATQWIISGTGLT